MLDQVFLTLTNIRSKMRLDLADYTLTFPAIGRLACR